MIYAIAVRVSTTRRHVARLASTVIPAVAEAVCETGTIAVTP